MGRAADAEDASWLIWMGGRRADGGECGGVENGDPGGEDRRVVAPLLRPPRGEGPESRNHAGGWDGRSAEDEVQSVGQDEEKRGADGGPGGLVGSEGAGGVCARVMSEGGRTRELRENDGEDADRRIEKGR